MRETKLISVRVDVATLAAIDNFCKLNRYWKRSAVINNILGNMVRNTHQANFIRVATHWPLSKEKLEILINDSSM